MQFNPGTGLGIVDEIDSICGSNSISYPIVDKTRRVNFALDQFYSIALAYDKHWTFDDVNQIDLPIAVADLVVGEQDYPFALELLTISSVFAKDSNGVFKKLEEEDEPENTFLLPGNSGSPSTFKIVGNSILLDFIPNYSSPLGLKVVFSRNTTKFDPSDTTKEMGIPSLFHEWICQVASLPYLVQNKLPAKNDIAVLIANKKDPSKLDSIPYFMANRNRTIKPHLGIEVENNR